MLGTRTHASARGGVREGAAGARRGGSLRKRRRARAFASLPAARRLRPLRRGWWARGGGVMTDKTMTLRLGTPWSAVGAAAGSTAVGVRLPCLLGRALSPGRCCRSAAASRARSCVRCWRRDRMQRRLQSAPCAVRQRAQGRAACPRAEAALSDCRSLLPSPSRLPRRHHRALRRKAWRPPRARGAS